MKECNTCHTDKPLEDFHKNCKSADGRLNRCKACTLSQNKERYHTDFDYRARCIWSTILQRVGSRNGKNKSYKHVKLEMTREEFIKWFSVACKKFVEENPGVTPSVDRKNNNKHYSLDNIQIISLAENSKTKPSNRNIHAPDGQAWCALCQQLKPKSEFHKNKAQRGGIASYCRNCMSEVKKEVVRLIRKRLAKIKVTS